MSRFLKEPREGTNEAVVLRALRDLSKDFGPGWNRQEDPPLVSFLTMQQTMGALERLRAKDLVEALQRHPGAGQGYLEFVWFSTGI